MGQKGDWTRRILPNVKRWYRSSTVLDYHLTQFLTEHGSFRSYLYKMKKAPSPICLYCAYPDDTAEHTVFHCPGWDVERLALGVFIGGRNPGPQDVQDLVCGPVLPEDIDPIRRRTLTEAASRATSAFMTTIRKIMKRKEQDEQLLEQDVELRRV